MEKITEKHKFTKEELKLFNEKFNIIERVTNIVEDTDVSYSENFGLKLNYYRGQSKEHSSKFYVITEKNDSTVELHRARYELEVIEGMRKLIDKEKVND